MESKVTVTRILDGDTFIAKSDGKEKFYRLLNVRAPERGMSGFSVAKSALKDLILKKEIVVEQKATGRYGRPLVDVKIDGKNVNSEMKKYE